ncbi:hypothetical protein H0H87_011687 [Tephrocybe sp. NHM501043]|nr:hypothetical protein H0H87_011687 [Tephrocybe sp. NHM501043]
MNTKPNPFFEGFKTQITSKGKLTKDPRDSPFPLSGQRDEREWETKRIIDDTDVWQLGARFLDSLSEWDKAHPEKTVASFLNDIQVELEHDPSKALDLMRGTGPSPSIQRPAADFLGELSMLVEQAIHNPLTFWDPEQVEEEGVTNLFIKVSTLEKERLRKYVKSTLSPCVAAESLDDLDVVSVGGNFAHIWHDTINAWLYDVSDTSPNFFWLAGTTSDIDLFVDVVDHASETTPRSPVVIITFGLDQTYKAALENTAEEFLKLFKSSLKRSTAKILIVTGTQSNEICLSFVTTLDFRHVKIMMLRPDLNRTIEAYTPKNGPQFMDLLNTFNRLETLTVDSDVPPYRLPYRHSNMQIVAHHAYTHVTLHEDEIRHILSLQGYNGSYSLHAGFDEDSIHLQSHKEEIYLLLDFDVAQETYGALAPIFAPFPAFVSTPNNLIFLPPGGTLQQPPKEALDDNGGMESQDGRTSSAKGKGREENTDDNAGPSKRGTDDDDDDDDDAGDKKREDDDDKGQGTIDEAAGNIDVLSKSRRHISIPLSSTLLSNGHNDSKEHEAQFSIASRIEVTVCGFEPFFFVADS